MKTLNTKSPFSSLTIIASVIGIVASIFGIDLSAEDQALIVANLDSLVTAAMFLFAIFGRFRATKQISLTPK